MAKKEGLPEDLAAIRGIGSGMQRRLNQAGIYTYAQLAGSTPEELRQLLGEATRLAKVEEWIEQARELAGVA
jgi:predicted flap endonuclease-1-like 5' DNA nuclease